MGIHDGHRARMKKLFRERGLDSFNDITALELLLYYAIPRGDTNPIAHRLLDRFGSLSGVFDASEKELQKVEGIGENAASLIRLIPEMSRRYLISRGGFDNILDSTEKTGNYIAPYFFAVQKETVYLISLDAKLRVINCRCVAEGETNCVHLSMRRIVEAALASGAVNAIIAHNHPSHIAIASQDDIDITEEIYSSLIRVDVELIDHIIVSGDDFVSLADDGLIKKLRKKYVGL